MLKVGHLGLKLCGALVYIDSDVLVVGHVVLVNVRWLQLRLLYQLLDHFKLLFDRLLDARLKHDELALTGTQSVTLAFEQENFLCQRVVSLKKLLLALLDPSLRLFDLLSALADSLVHLIEFSHALCNPDLFIFNAVKAVLETFRELCVLHFKLLLLCVEEFLTSLDA